MEPGCNCTGRYTELCVRDDFERLKFSSEKKCKGILARKPICTLVNSACWVILHDFCRLMTSQVRPETWVKVQNFQNPELLKLAYKNE